MATIPKNVIKILEQFVAFHLLQFQIRNMLRQNILKPKSLEKSKQRQPGPFIQMQIFFFCPKQK